MLNDNSYRTGTYQLLLYVNVAEKEKLLSNFYCDVTNMMKLEIFLWTVLKIGAETGGTGGTCLPNNLFGGT